VSQIGEWANGPDMVGSFYFLFRDVGVLASLARSDALFRAIAVLQGLWSTSDQQETVMTSNRNQSSGGKRVPFFESLEARQFMSVSTFALSTSPTTGGATVFTVSDQSPPTKTTSNDIVIVKVYDKPAT